MNAFTKTLYLGSYEVSWRGAPINVYVAVKFDGKRLSITGVESPFRNGNCAGSCGQITDSLALVTTPATNWTLDDIAKLAAIWQRWHLNDMRAGNALQESYLRQNPISPYDYKAACAALDSAGLNPDGDRYGHKWHFEAVPGDVLEWLASLPAPTINPAWI